MSFDINEACLDNFNIYNCTIQLLFTFTEIFKSCCSVKLCEYKMLPSLIVINSINLFASPHLPPTLH